MGLGAWPHLRAGRRVCDIIPLLPALVPKSRVVSRGLQVSNSAPYILPSSVMFQHVG